jgi:UrcA family protein
MKTLAKALAAASLSLAALAPAASEQPRVTISYGDLDIATQAGAEALNVRLLNGISAACVRPDVRDVRAGAAWEACKDAAMSRALEQLALKGASRG